MKQMPGAATVVRECAKKVWLIEHANFLGGLLTDHFAIK